MTKFFDYTSKVKPCHLLIVTENTSTLKTKNLKLRDCMPLDYTI